MTAKSPAFTRPQLRKAYLYVVDNWAVDAPEVAKHLKFESNAQATKILKELQKVGLVVSEKISGERQLTWQSYHDVQNEDGAREAAVKDFDEAFPKGKKIAAPKPGPKNPATGSRYTPEQLKAGRDARMKGESWINVAKKVGVKSDFHFSKAVRAAYPETEKKSAPAKAKGPKIERDMALDLKSGRIVRRKK